MASVRPLSRAAAIIASQSSSDDASGFSTIAWAPARRAGTVTAAWAGCGVATTTAWTPAPTISSTLVKGFTPYCSPKARAFAGVPPAHRHELGLGDRGERLRVGVRHLAVADDRRLELCP